MGKRALDEKGAACPDICDSYSRCPPPLPAKRLGLNQSFLRLKPNRVYQRLDGVRRSAFWRLAALRVVGNGTAISEGSGRVPDDLPLHFRTVRVYNTVPTRVNRNTSRSGFSICKGSALPGFLGFARKGCPGYQEGSRNR